MKRKIKWQKIEIYDRYGQKIYNIEQRKTILRQYKETGFMDGFFFVNPITFFSNGAAALDRAKKNFPEIFKSGPSRKEIDWEGIEG